MKKIIFFILVSALCISAAISVSAADNKIAFSSGSGLSVADEQYVIGAPIDAKAQDITKRTTGEVSVFTADKNNGTHLADTDSIFTGTKVRAEKYGIVTDELLVVVKGDLDGNGKVQSNDYLKIKKHFAGSELEGIQLVAADINSDNEIKSTDYLAVKKYFQGKYNLYPALGPETTDIPVPTENPNPLAESVEYANLVKNSVQSCFSSGNDRAQYIMSNPQLTIYQGLTETGKKNAQLVTNPDGGVYLEDTLDVFVEYENFGRKYLKDSISSADNVPNVVTTKLGYYFNENHIRNLYFQMYPHLLDLTYNMLPDKTTVQDRLVIKNASKTELTFGGEVKIAKSTVASISIGGSRTYSSTEGIDTTNVSYVAFDIKDAGVIGFIVPTDAIYQNVYVKDDGTNYVVTFEAQLSNVAVDDEFNLCYILYADETHNFDGVKEAAYRERNQVNVTVGETVNKSASFTGYTTKYGMYELKGDIKYANFNNAYENPNVLFLSNTTVTSDDHDRVVWMLWRSGSGGLECASVLDENGQYAAIPTEVCKNFTGEYEDRTYDPTDAGYGDCIYPVYVKAGKSETLKTSLYLQNWGKFPCQQISSIQFFSTYYHQSTGATETTCIAPMGTYWKDGLLYPDFRGASGYLWAYQPQHWCAGFMKFFHTVNASMYSQWPEYTESNIISSGPTYGEIECSYVADDGSYKYTMTSLEFPQLDETRNYQVVEVEFLKDTTIKQASQKLRLFLNLNENAGYRKIAYLDENGNEVVKDGILGNTLSGKINKDSAYFALYDTANSETENFGAVMRKLYMTVNGEEQDVGLVYNLTSKTGTTGKNCTELYFSPAVKSLDFKAGDKIRLEFILVPFGQHEQTSFDSVKNVYNDSVINPMSAVAITGTVTEHPYMALFNAENGKAEFTLSGSANANTIRVDGFTASTRPVIEEYVDGAWVEYVTYSDNLYDGYACHYNEDGTYGFSWVVNMGSGAERHFRVVQ